ncbi:Pimeloyl-ACP methyl ester carboxylesterase [Nitrosospira multiformis ATCC 25196]|uniref:Alpha/beta hydrolase fold protein n=1 Tax=Nitrosospira multiformis (strain ATCC 25196 / NCIMB 11849 / C 71) TaxID=323848 RepID=Q2Y8N8_NITMU|nr:alpha/beta hydrolase [Nitrosospira multiformis]ABB74883.1 Alpha/beta hydrolase fold protein [Nitrosospira multiformis ATCC 25196]SEG08706.1 Pimeloyl-ACP methyl ester carboxylesterase [Nitrosospira multiformis ATCC 25196]
MPGSAFLCHTAAAVLLLLCSGCVHTVPFRDATGNIIPGSIASMETIIIGGIPQNIWFRGISTSNPPLILLHGGPGASESALFRHYNSLLEQHFTVVYWEQRGTGRSFHSNIPPESMSIAQFVHDLDEVVEYVRHRFNKEKVILVGHSWGTVPGIIHAGQHPEKISAYVGIAQVADVPEGRRLSYGFALSEAKNRGNAKAVSELEAIGPPPYASLDERLTTAGWVERFGGIFHTNLSTGKLIWTALNTDEANLIDLIKFGQGNRFSLVQLENEISRLDLSERYRSFRIPIFFLLGRYDKHVPATLAERYFETIEAPCKRLVWFENSAHNPPFEEPARFNRILIEEVLPVVNSVDCKSLQHSSCLMNDACSFRNEDYI